MSRPGMSANRDGRDVNRQPMPGTVTVNSLVRSCWRSCGFCEIHPPDPALVGPPQVCICELSAALEKTLIGEITIPIAQHPACGATPADKPNPNCPGRPMDTPDGRRGLQKEPAQHLADPIACHKCLIIIEIGILKLYLQTQLFALFNKTQE